jgi:hypothetical protein
MYLGIEAGAGAVQVALREAADLRSLRVATDLGPEDLGRVLTASGLGLLIGDAAWLDVAALRVLALLAVRASDQATGFDAMITYAGEHDWLSPGGTHVRAHVSGAEPAQST